MSILGSPDHSRTAKERTYNFYEILWSAESHWCRAILCSAGPELRSLSTRKSFHRIGGRFLLVSSMPAMAWMVLHMGISMASEFVSSEESKPFRYNR